ncbi:MAG: TonB-dependent receptor [Deltaproteobacteria bacterium]|jgi:vitamin B12 transporter|nr:TonB-dependent receptor [Deltaproteobacteria bacterium]
MLAYRLPTVCAPILALLLSATALHAQGVTQASSPLDPVVVTAAPQGEQRHKSTATVVVIDQEQINAAGVTSLTDLIATTAGAFFSEWTPAQTSINIRGGLTDGQGKDFKGHIMVLMNGRRAGTANISKLSPNEVERVEIMRGPNSVMYGSQAIGGIVNIILKSGRTSDGGLVDVRGGSGSLVQGHLEYARTLGASEDFAFFVGGDWGHKSDYHAGKGGGKEINTAWTRKGGLIDLDWKVNESNTFQLTARSDGIYNTGFRGSGANYFTREDRSNHSLDLVWELRPSEFPLDLDVHGYMVLDIDHFKWGSPLTTNFDQDFNKRKLSIAGIRLQPVWHVTDYNDLRFGIDYEFSTLRSNRFRRNRTTGEVQVIEPQDYNQTEKILAFYIEDTLRLLDDRLTIRAGARHTTGWLSSDNTPGALDQLLSSDKYTHLTWSAGLNFAVTDSVSLRAGAATGFRSPVASEKTGYMTPLNAPTTKIYGNPDVKPETNIMLEAGLYAFSTGWFADLAVFRNEIKDRIGYQTIPGSADSKYQNNPGKIVVSGVELSGRVNVDELADMGDWRLAFGLYGSYNFKMEDEAKTRRLVQGSNSNKVERMYQYQGSVFAQLGRAGSVPWSARITGVLRGPVWYNTEEGLLIPNFRPTRQWTLRKAAYWVFNFYGEASVTDSFTVYGGVNNILNKNHHPLFFALDNGGINLASTSSNGGLGTSAPGTEFFLGVKYAF